ncbi:putative manganese transporter [Alteromonas sp. D210916BOD_24]|uniref:putative manganese transporter n=1 Tax=Alteromonas sp. D210916BOD_24 TaxID=3157618 RepID=UPI00399CB96A
MDTTATSSNPRLNKNSVPKSAKHKLISTAYLSSFSHRLTSTRWLYPLLLIALLCVESTRATVVTVLADAYFQVAAFVYASLALYYVATLRIPSHVIASFMRKHPIYEVGLSAILGALPGCGGAIIVVTQYTKGVTSFGAVVAVLTSTMGDAAFLLLAQAPWDALTVMGISVVVGSVTGITVNYIHSHHALRYGNKDSLYCQPISPRAPLTKRMVSISQHFWLVVSIPSLIIAIALAFQVPVNRYLGLSQTWFNATGATLGFVAIVLWSLSGTDFGYSSLTKEDKAPPPVTWKAKAALDTQFVLAWVVFAFLLFELSAIWFEFDLTSSFESMGSGLIVLAIVIGFLPGCGPQILVTTLYLNGGIPFSAQLGNAISNDGDALFPAIALSPKAAIIATVYSAVPAFLVGYGYWYLFE